MEFNLMNFCLNDGAGKGAIRRAGRLALLTLMAAGLAACGGGGGGGGGGNSSPLASFTATPQTGDAPLNVAFDASASSDPDGSISSYAWEFGDGGTGSGRTVSHTYTTAGAFAARLTVTDNNGASRTTSRTISVAQPSGDLLVRVREEFSTPVVGATVTVVAGSSSPTDTTDGNGEVVFTDLPAGDATVTISQSSFAPKDEPVTIVASQQTTLDVTLSRIKSAVGGVFTTEVIGVPSANGREVTFDVTFVVVNQDSQGIGGLTNAAFFLPACTPVVPDPDARESECVRSRTDNFLDAPYTVVSGTPAPGDVREIPPGQPTDYAASLMLDQSGSVNVTDPTGARLVSAKAFVQAVTPASNDAVLLAAFAEDNNTQAALIPEQPMTIYGAFTDNGVSYFDELETLRDQTSGDTPLYRTLYPEPGDSGNDPAFTVGLIEHVNDTAPAGKRHAIAIFTDGDDEECGGPRVCRDKRERVVAQAVANNVDLFTIGLSPDVNFEALGELARDANGAFLFATSAEQLIPLYGSLGALLSRSLVTYKVQWTIQSDTDGTFQSGHSVLGKARVDADGSVFDVPFIVGIE